MLQFVHLEITYVTILVCLIYIVRIKYANIYKPVNAHYIPVQITCQTDIVVAPSGTTFQRCKQL